MNYKKLYDQIIENAKNRNIIENKYYEEHHIIPKCLNGTNDDNNLVKLTLREHYVCHKLLAEIYKDNKSIWHAYWMMMISTLGALENIRKDNYYRVDGQKLRRIKPILEGEKINISSREYEYCREYWTNLIKGTKRTKEQCENISNKTKIAMANPETRKKCGEKNKGSKHYYNILTGEAHKWHPGDPEIDLTIFKWGRAPLSEEHRKKLSETQTQDKTLCRIKNTNFRYIWYKKYIKQIPDCLEDLHVKQNNSLKQIYHIFIKAFNILKYDYNVFIENDIMILPHTLRGGFHIISPSVIEICHDLLCEEIIDHEKIAKRIVNNIDKIKELNKKYFCIKK